jgi:hypothetical protein
MYNEPPPQETQPPNGAKVPRKPEEAIVKLPGTTTPCPSAKFGCHSKFTAMVSVQFEVHGWVAVKIAQAFTSYSILSAQVGMEQTTSVARTTKNLRIRIPLLTPRR